MTLAAPLHQNMTGNAAYFVAPATVTFKVKDRPVVQSGAIFTVALRNGDGHWLIAVWAWTKGIGGGVDDAKNSAANR